METSEPPPQVKKQKDFKLEDIEPYSKLVSLQISQLKEVLQLYTDEKR